MSEEIQEEEILGPSDAPTLSTPEVPQDTGHIPKKREEIKLVDDLGAGNRYIEFKMKSVVEMITAKIEKVEDDKYCLSNSKNADGKSYKIEITDQDGQILSVTAWDLWNKLKIAFKDLNALAPVTLKLSHTGHSTYEVEYMKEGKMVKVVPEK